MLPQGNIPRPVTISVISVRREAIAFDPKRGRYCERPALFGTTDRWGKNRRFVAWSRTPQRDGRWVGFRMTANAEGP